MTRARLGLCLALALVAACVLIARCSRRELVRAGDGLSVEGVEESVPRAGALLFSGDVTWNGSRATAQLINVTFVTAPLPAVVAEAAGMADDGDPQAVRMQARRADGSTYTWSLAYSHCADDLCSWSFLTAEGIADARKRAGESSVGLHLTRFPMLPDVVALRVMVGPDVALSIEPPKDPSVTLTYGSARPEHRRAFDLGKQTTVLEASATGPRWMRVIHEDNPTSWRWMSTMSPAFIVPEPYKQRFRIEVTDGFQLVSATVELDASDDLPEAAEAERREN